MKPRKIKENIYWMGSVIWDRRLFDSLAPLPDGTSDNAYLIEGREKTALIRKAVDQFIISGKPDRSTLYRQAELVVGKYKCDTGDVSIDHDRYLEEAFGL